MTPPSAVPSVIPQTGKQQLLLFLQICVKSQTGPTHGTSFNPDKSHIHNISPKEHLEKPPIDFLNNPLKEVLYFKPLWSHCLP